MQKNKNKLQLKIIGTLFSQKIWNVLFVLNYLFALDKIQLFSLILFCGASNLEKVFMRIHSQIHKYFWLWRIDIQSLFRFFEKTHFQCLTERTHLSLYVYLSCACMSVHDPLMRLLLIWNGWLCRFRCECFSVHRWRRH